MGVSAKRERSARRGREGAAAPGRAHATRPYPSGPTFLFSPPRASARRYGALAHLLGVSSAREPSAREYRLTLEVPRGSWCALASPPGARVLLRVLALSTLDEGRVVEDVEIIGPTWRQALEGIRQHPAVAWVKVLREAEDGGTLRVVHAECALASAIRSTHVLPHFPLRFQGAEEHCVVQATPRDAEAFARALAAGGTRSRVESVRAPGRGSALTPRQQEVLEAARRAGYYDRPRRISLSELAKSLGVAKSTLSEMLVHIESHLARSEP